MKFALHFEHRESVPLEATNLSSERSATFERKIIERFKVMVSSKVLENKQTFNEKYAQFLAYILVRSPSRSSQGNAKENYTTRTCCRLFMPTAANMTNMAAILDDILLENGGN